MSRSIGARLALACLCMATACAAQAEAPAEFWPEASVYVALGPATRLFLDLPYSTIPGSGTGTLGLAAYLDISLLPLARLQLREQDWQRSRFFWARVGVNHIVNSEDGTRSVAEDRAVVSLYGKAGLPEEIWLEARARADLRWIDGNYSTRYRFRLELTREFTLLDRAVVPYANVEWFYDTRYDGLSRTRYQVGSEFTVSPHFRFELYGAHQVDQLPAASSLNALGVVAKWYY